MRLKDFHRIDMRADPKTGLFAIFALHDLTLGPALGGVRRWAYPDETTALADAVHLARAMTAKNALADLPFGGGKAVVAAPGAPDGEPGPPSRPITQAELLKLGDWIQDIGGEYVAAADVGMRVDDLMVSRDRTRHLAGILPESDTGPRTALGVFGGIEVIAKRLGFADLAGVRVAVQGLGKVGMPLAELLRDAGAVLTVADIDQAKTAAAAERLGATTAAVDDVLAADVDIVSPCALGGAITSAVAETIRAGGIAGAANNQLAEPCVAAILKRRDVLFAPDYAINAGGVISAGLEYLRSDQFDAYVGQIGPRLERILDEAKATGKTEYEVAESMAKARVARAA